jgi:hypothetical protein
MKNSLTHISRLALSLSLSLSFVAMSHAQDQAAESQTNTSQPLTVGMANLAPQNSP